MLDMLENSTSWLKSGPIVDSREPILRIPID